MPDDDAVLSLDAMIPKLMAAAPADVPALLDKVLVSDEQRAFMKETGADIWAGTANVQDSVPFAGTIPSLVPNTTNRLVVVRTTKMVGDSSINFWPSVKTATTVLTLHYFPRYVNVRPAST